MIMPFSYIPRLNVIAQPSLETIKQRNLVLDLGNGLKTNAQLTYPSVGKGPYPGVLLIHGSGANDMNETNGGYIRVDNKTGSKVYPPQLMFQIAQFLSERGYAVLRYDKRGVTSNFTILDPDVWGNLTIDQIVQDADKALQLLVKQPEVDTRLVSVLGHSEGGLVAPRIAIDNPGTVKNVILMATLAQNISKILDFQVVGLPLLYAHEVLDKNHNGSLPVQEASNDPIFKLLIGGNTSSIFRLKLNNDSKRLNPEYNPNRDAYIDINTELKPALIDRVKSFFAPGSVSGKCINLEGCPAYQRSFFAVEPNLNTIDKIPSNTSILILQGENDTQVPVQQAYLLQQKLTEIKHPDHLLITYPDLGHSFFPSSQWVTEYGPLPHYVLQDIFAWLTDPTRNQK